MQEAEIDQAKNQVQGQLAAQYIQDVMQATHIHATMLHRPVSKKTSSLEAVAHLTDACHMFASESD